ncbi:glycine zipper 2TM domain-containing protein [Sphingomonas sp. AR_OL41]|uniref:glycine zipper 2TM domain-containing protein n=1 Tax=Sphingomonas sp. AR_OL41 TaxID=3042729 RepID=UPI0024804801|nr:glycine zipper 2TM domain-containing protein [Sphingomonas sp. AR_OL41]MDH7975600.1 glycine zipper 2TM domain-containing protein [Sphingomonas sp. AR_OL41]
MRIAMLGALAAATLLAGCETYDNGRPGYGSGYSQYDYNRPDPSYNGYYADKYYRDGPRYRNRRLSQNDRVYVGQDGRYYCRRNDGTTGLIVGGIAGGVLGSIIAPGGSETLGALLGAAGGAVAGRAIERNNVSCR